MKAETEKQIEEAVLKALEPFTEELNAGSQSDRFIAIGIASGALTTWAKEKLVMGKEWFEKP